MINIIGYDLLDRKQVDLAIEIFKFNVEKFPNSYIVYESLGDAYMKNGDFELAMENYNKSLEINPHNNDITKKLSEIDKKKSP